MSTYSPASVALFDWLTPRRDEIVDDLRRLVEIESPNGDLSLLETCATELQRWFGQIGEVTVLRPVAGRAPHLLVETAEPTAAATTTLTLCHYDTVWPAGEVERRPFSVRGDIASGPGVLDMKGGIVMAHWARKALAALGLQRFGGRLLISADEESGSTTSEETIARLAREASTVFVLEPPLADGSLKTARKGWTRLRCEVGGRAAHAGIEPHRGINAAVEAARVAVAADRLNDPAAGTSVVVGVMRAGTKSNVVPATAELEIDVRAMTTRALDEVIAHLRAIEPTVDGATIDVEVLVRRGPMERGEATDRLLAEARALAEPLGLSLTEASTGGLSEGNIAAATGTPTLDGLGAMGDGAHMTIEWIDIPALIQRTALHAGMLVGDASRPDGS